MAIELSDSSARGLLALALAGDDDWSAATAIRTDDTIRYTPGSIVAGRFRVTALAGRGGMGDVYRAEDLKLGQSVALKFLPGTGKGDPAIMQRFHDEVRVGRQVAHPNVCRIYDLLEMDGRPAIVMEFVEGEDLAALLGRGGLPYAMALQIARDVCAGVEAVHDKGIIHGDLKPSNVMIDGRGRARITDFGLSRIAEEKIEQRVAGTIAYMAPEQFTTRAASERSDLYSLGMVLYEIFTGQRARKESDPTKPEYAAMPPPISQRQPAIEPALDRTILRCLQPDPEQRPSSAARVRSTFPPGDILDAVLAAGETPPAEFVAESRKVTPLRRTQSRVIAAAALVLLLMTVIASQHLTLYGRSPLPLSPSQLAARARMLLGRFSVVGPIADEVSWFTTDLDSRSRSSELPPIVFQYRLSASPFAAYVDEHARMDDAPRRGDATVEMTATGRLLHLIAILPDAVPQVPARSASWEEVLSSAGFDPRQATARETRWVPAVPYDEKREWDVDRNLVRASRFRGLLTSFEVVPPSSASPLQLMRRSKLPDIVYFTILLLSVLVGAFLAQKNIRRRSVDSVAAWRAALTVFFCRAAYGLIAGHRAMNFEAEYRSIVATLGTALLVAAQVGLAYVALEPYVRRRWPEAMIGWARLVRGRFRDPVVGRDLLVGASAGLAIRLVDHVRNAAAPIANGRVIPSHLAVDALSSIRETAGGLFAYSGRAIFFALFAFFVLVLLRRVLRSHTAAAVAWLVVATLAWIRWDDPVIEVVVVMTQMTILLWALQRFGLLAMTAAIFVHLVTVYTPLTADIHAFYFGQSAIAVAALATLIVYAAVAATVRQPAETSSTP